MKFNSQICTTKEQSERLLALGLKKETADMCLRPDNTLIPIHENSFIYHNLESTIQEGYCPAWSLHRLIEILPIAVWIDGFRFPLRSDAIHRLSEVSSIYDTIIGIIERTVEMGYLNQEYLKQ